MAPGWPWNRDPLSRTLRLEDQGPIIATGDQGPFTLSPLPEESRALKAPLAVSAGGWGQMSENGWRDTTDADYVATRRLVEAAIAPLLAHDIAGTCGHDDKCLCDCCWVRRLVQTAKQYR